MAFVRIILKLSLSLICLRSMASSVPSPSVLVANCETEQKLNKHDGSCLFLGIFAQKNEDFNLYNRIQTSCADMARRGLITSQSHLSGFLPYYPKCLYIYNQKKQKMDEIVDSQTDLKRLVRFLNH